MPFGTCGGTSGLKSRPPGVRQWPPSSTSSRRPLVIWSCNDAVLMAGVNFLHVACLRLQVLLNCPFGARKLSRDFEGGHLTFAHFFCFVRGWRRIMVNFVFFVPVLPAKRAQNPAKRPQNPANERKFQKVGQTTSQVQRWARMEQINRTGPPGTHGQKWSIGRKPSFWCTVDLNVRSFLAVECKDNKLSHGLSSFGWFKEQCLLRVPGLAPLLKQGLKAWLSNKWPSPAILTKLMHRSECLKPH